MTMSAGAFEVEIRPLGDALPGPVVPGPVVIAVRHPRCSQRAGAVLFETPPDGRFLGALHGEVSYEDHFGGSFEVACAPSASLPVTVVESVESVERVERVESAASGSLRLRGRLVSEGSDAGSTAGFEVVLSEVSDGDLRIEAALDISGWAAARATGVTRLVLRMRSEPEEAFFGFGEQLTYCDLSGQVVPLVSQEHGIGRGLPVVTDGVNALIPGAGGTPVSTGSPSAFWHTSAGRSVLLEGSEYGEVDLSRPEEARLEHHAKRLAAHVFAASDPVELLGLASAHTGRMRPLPTWVHEGAILGLQGGTARVEEALECADRAGVALSALWLQDWCGRRESAFGSQLWWDWRLDEERYPGWRDMVARLAERGIRVLTYVNPYLSTTPGHDVLYAHALARGYLVTDDDGAPYMIPNSDVGSAVVDLSNPDAGEWISGVIAGMAEETGCSGWMADFAEGLPMQGVRIAAGDPRSFHNSYPVVWAEVNRRAADSTTRPGEMLPFHRSGFTESPRHLTLGWLGDQLQTWDEHDGMKSAVCGMVSGGLSGFSVLHADVGGYLSLPNPWGGERLFTRDPELLMRWMELGALSPVMRTHEGLDPSSNLQWDSTAELLEHFRRCSLIYRAWGEYRRALAGEVSSAGLPVTRHPYLHFPEDPATWGLRHQYMLGSELMVAPVLDPGVSEVAVYLPRGRWERLWTGEAYGDERSGGWATVPAPLGSPVLLGRLGSEVGASISARLQEI